MSESLELILEARDLADHLESELQIIEICLDHLCDFSDETQVIANLQKIELMLDHFRSSAEHCLSDLKFNHEQLAQFFEAQDTTTGDKPE